MKNCSFLFIFVVAVAAGCQSDPQSDDKDLRAKMQKGMDPESIKPEQRSMVLAQMRANGAAAKADELAKKWGLDK